MKNIELLPHNEIGYQELTKAIKDHQMVSINRATGTGKSFILLKYLYQNKDKRILYLAPTYPIIDQLMEEHMEELGIKKQEFLHIDGMIYSNLLTLNMEKLAQEYDIIVLDEYHRCGAPLWGKKVRELLDILAKTPLKKVIGTTATEIRYLDKERNMNKILFNGFEVGRLSLADAILNGILPAPLYVSFNISMLEDLEKLEEIVFKYAFYDKEKTDAFREIQEIRRKLESTLYDNKSIKEYLRDCRKYLVFSSTIYNIKRDQGFMNRLLGYNHKTFIVHSEQTKEKNKRMLKEFRDYPKDEISLLYSIDILNEGVHVKGADAAVLRRRTTSPIIYFQQLGRLLSYSRRKDEVVILDMVNNIKNHPVIYELYQDVCRRAEELIKETPEKREHYEMILKRFRIVNATSKLAEELEILKQKYSKNMILERRLAYAISILEDANYPNDVEKSQARADIIRYEDYITPSLFDKIKSLNSFKRPSICRLSHEEFLEYLNGSRNIRAKRQRNLKEIYKKMQEFYDYNYRLPSIFSEDKIERDLAIVIMNRFYDFNIKESTFIKDNISSDLSIFERLNYGEEIEDIDYDKLIRETDEASSLGVQISHNVYLALIGKVDRKVLEKMILNNRSKNELEEILEEAKLEEAKNKKREDDIIYRREFEEIASKMLEEIRKIGIDEYVDKLFQDIMNFISQFQKDLDYYEPSGSTLSIQECNRERELYCKRIILQSKLTEKGYMKQIDDLVLEVKMKNQFVKMNDLAEAIVAFVMKHEGSLPSTKNYKHENERELASAYSKNYCNMPDELKAKIFDAQSKFPHKKEEILRSYINFLRKYKRKPMFDEKFPEEVKLNEEFNRWQVFFTENEQKELENALKNLNKYEDIRNTYRALMKGKKQ